MNLELASITVWHQSTGVSSSSIFHNTNQPTISEAAKQSTCDVWDRIEVLLSSPSSDSSSYWGSIETVVNSTPVFVA